MSEFCPICETRTNRNSKQQFFDSITNIEYRLYRCRSCQIEFWSPLIMPPASYYEKLGGDYNSLHFSNQSDLRWWHKTFFRNYPDLKNTGKILDIGCGDGRFLFKMKEIGWDVYGIELDSLSATNAKTKYGINNIYVCTLDEYIKSNSNKTKFDLITFFEVMEHQPDPNRFLNSIKSLLKESGFIAGSVPNRNRYLIPKRISPDIPPHHFTLWNKKIIRRFLLTKGFSLVKFKLTRFEPIFINQIINQFFYKKKIKIYNSINAGNRADSNQRTLLQKIKRVINPFLKALEFLEYPFIYGFRASISILFIFRLNDK